MEKRDLYDINRNLTGETIYKDEPVPYGRYITVVLSFIENSKGEFLIQKRSMKKGGKYGSTGGHPKSGENSLHGMITEIKEEIGLEVNADELEHIYSEREDTTNTFFDMYYLKKDFDANKLTLQEEEVESVEWLSISQIRDLISKGLFFESHIDALNKFIEIFEKRGIKIE